MSNNGRAGSNRLSSEFEEIPSSTNNEQGQEPGEIIDNISPSIPSSATQRSNTQPSISNDSRANSNENETRRNRLESFIKDFRDRKRSKLDAFSAILGELEKATGLTVEEKETTYQLYSSEITSAESRSKQQLSFSTNQRGDTGETRTIKPIEHFVRSDDEPKSDGDDDEPRKRPRLEESDMPWIKLAPLDEPRADPSCIKTIEFLQLFHSDIKKAKFYVSIARGAPDNIPPSQWERILKGESIDLDQILSSLHRITVDEDRNATISETTIIFRAPEAARKVTSSSEWSAAWRRAARAVAFVFPHRTRELEDYAEYIENEFAAKNASGHYRIIQYDIAIRNLVRGGQQTLLTDTHKFVSLYSAIVMPDGVQYASGSRKPPLRGKTEICNRFNDKGCHASTCRYRHTCKTCGSTNHGRSSCNSPSKDSSVRNAT
jgi:hypothetical protein